MSGFILQLGKVIVSRLDTFAGDALPRGTDIEAIDPPVILYVRTEL